MKGPDRKARAVKTASDAIMSEAAAVAGLTPNKVRPSNDYPPSSEGRRLTLWTKPSRICWQNTASVERGTRPGARSNSAVVST